MIIRRADQGEEEQILSFYHDLIDGMRDMAFRPYWSKGVYPVLEDIRSAVERGEMYIALEDGIVGTFILNHAQADGYTRVSWPTEAAADKTAVIHLLAVSPACQGRGVGKQLLQKAAALCRESGDTVIRLDTLTWNEPGHKLYTGFGFRYCGDLELTYASTGTIPFSMFEYRVR